jgi:phosphate uptake regulator
MELRKIQLTGGSSYTVTLPKEWVSQAQLNAGDVVGFNPQSDGSLAVYPHARLSSTQARFETEVTNDDTDATFRTIIAAYLNGYDIIVVRSKRPLPGPVRRAVRQASKRIVGLQVTEEDANNITLQDFMDPKEFHIDKGLRRMQALTRSMQEDALKSFQDDQDEIDSTFSERDDEVDSLYWMINKQYHALLRDPTYAQKMGLSANQALNYLLTARLIERTADHAARIAENIHALRGDEIKQKLESKIEKQARKAFQLFSDSVAAFHKRDSAGANKIIEEAEAFRAGQDAVIKESLSLGGASILHVAYALDSIGRTAAYAADVAETAINHGVVMGGPG